MRKGIDKSKPVYIQIKNDLLEKINNGEFRPSEAIPSETELSDYYGVSRITVRSAISEIQREGLLYPVKGKGVYVIGRVVKRDLDRLQGFTQAVKELKDNQKTSLINSFTRKAGPYYADILGIDENEKIHYIKRLNSVNDEPFSIEEIYIPVKILPNLMKINTNNFSLYDIYDYYGIEFTHAKQKLEVTTLDQNEARILDITKNTPVFLLKCITFSDKNPIEYSIRYVRGDKSRFHSDFNRDFNVY